MRHHGACADQTASHLSLFRRHKLGFQQLSPLGFVLRVRLILRRLLHSTGPASQTLSDETKASLLQGACTSLQCHLVFALSFFGDLRQLLLLLLLP